MLSQQLVDVLRAERERLGLTQKDVAERMGRHESFVQIIEYNKRDPRVSTLQRYADALDVGLEVRLIHR